MIGSSNPWIIPVTGGLLCVYALVVAFGLLSDSNDPQRGMAVGLLMAMLMAICFFGGLLWLASHPYRPWLAWTLFVITAYPGVMYLAMQIFLLFKRTQQA